MSDVWPFIVVVVVIVIACLWYTRDEQSKTKIKGPPRPDDGIPNRRKDGSIPGQMRGFNPGAEGPDGKSPVSDRRGFGEGG